MTTGRVWPKAFVEPEMSAPRARPTTWVLQVQNLGCPASLGGGGVNMKRKWSRECVKCGAERGVGEGAADWPISINHYTTNQGVFDPPCMWLAT